MVQPDLKKLVAYSSVSHLGFVALGISAMNVQGVQGAVYQMLAHGVSTGALFLIVGMLSDRRHTRLIAEFGGLKKVLPKLSSAFLVVTLASIGLPGLNGFVGELLILVGRVPLGSAAGGVRRVRRAAVGGLHAVDVPARQLRAGDERGERDAAGSVRARALHAVAGGRDGDRHGRVSDGVPEADGACGGAAGRAGEAERGADGRTDGIRDWGLGIGQPRVPASQSRIPNPESLVPMMTEYLAVVPLVCVWFGGILAMIAEAFRSPGERMPIAGIGDRRAADGGRDGGVAVEPRRGELRRRRRPTTSACSSRWCSCSSASSRWRCRRRSSSATSINAGEYYALTLFAIGGMMLMAIATDLLVIFIALEILSLGGLYPDRHPARVEGGRRGRVQVFPPRRFLERVLPLRHRVHLRHRRHDEARRDRRRHVAV